MIIYLIIIYNKCNKYKNQKSNIWNYTIETWSENQAEIYYSLLIDSCQEIANKPNLGKSYEVIEKNIWGFKTGQHVIFYQILSNKSQELA